MRAFLLMLSLSFFTPMASATDVTLKEAMKVLEHYNVGSLNVALFFGEPRIIGQLDDKGFSIKLKGCEDQSDDFHKQYSCAILIYDACLEAADLNERDGLLFSNQFNSEDLFTGRAFVSSEIGQPVKMCLKHRSELSAEDRFDTLDIYVWEEAIKDFEEQLEIYQEDKLAATASVTRWDGVRPHQ